MNGHIKLFVIVAIAVALAAGIFISQQQASNSKTPDATGGQPPKTGSPETFCTTDDDCVPAECCHPTSAVNRNFAPDCTGTFCTAYCAPDTLDCGGGEVKCIKNKCEVVLK